MNLNFSGGNFLMLRNYKYFATLILTILLTQPGYADTWKEMGKNTLLFPVKTAAVATGLTIGIPIAMIRYSCDKSSTFTQSCAEKIGGKECVPSIIFGAVPGVTGGILAGCGEGLFYGTKNAIEHGVNKPFSQSSFSIDTDLE